MKTLNLEEMEVEQGGMVAKDWKCAGYAIGFIVGAGFGQPWFAVGMGMGWASSECWHY